ncbi:dinuclear metal center YbgI/SA1388 family protein [Haloactinopolyspora alba]|uniref:GTP cyclohydrolase 1 type 2 homolog n=1 Tax=Haloactinopolyspora alba TaxID=648780 RepID=A0A2P8E047_9ACTN|nr:Nif3-like dinuclear metal center hexameric protein [Haloactinopolyspora alba]PSL02855.1 dinuclear metal center YbgI/SA1388 family protein [Haloactinopolyspora alba]
MPALADVVAVLERHYPPRLAESWDAVGLVCGDPGADVRRVLFAVDPVQSVVDEALETGADLIVTHHPLFLRPVHGVAATTPKGRLVHRLVTGGVALYTAHTNADKAVPGVNDALADALGLGVVGPLAPDRPDHGPDHAADGAVGLEGLGRIGTLPAPETLSAFVRRVARALPPTASGVRTSGDPGATVRTVAVCGGAGDALLETARSAGVDAYVTADLRHHPSSESDEAEGPALVDVAHWASEWPWLAPAARRLVAGLSEQGPTVETHISDTPTDPWTVHQPSRESGATDEGSPS